MQAKSTSIQTQTNKQRRKNMKMLKVKIKEESFQKIEDLKKLLQSRGKKINKDKILDEILSKVPQKVLNHVLDSLTPAEYLVSEALKDDLKRRKILKIIKEKRAEKGANEVSQKELKEKGGQSWKSPKEI